MENKIVLELIRKNLEEINYLFDILLKEEKADPLLIEIATLKAKTLYQELRLLLPKGSTVETSEADLDVSDAPLPDQAEEVTVIQQEPEEELVIMEEPLPEENTLQEMIVVEEIIEEVIAEPIVDEAIQEIHDEPVVPEEPGPVVEEEASTEEEEQPVISIDEEPEPDEEEKLETKEEEPKSQVEEQLSEEVVSEVAEEVNEPSGEVVPLIEPEPEVLVETTEAHELLKEEPVSEQSEKKVFGEQFTKETSLNDKLASANVHESKFKAQPIASIKGSIGLNDRFLFTRELFGNDGTLFESTIDQLDQFTTILEAVEYLEKHFQWIKNNASLKFMELVKRRFEK
jgi:hypothetical protein